MKKIFDFYKNNKIWFYLICIVWIGFFTNIFASAVFYLDNKTFSGYGNPGYIRVTAAGERIEILALIGLAVFVIIPVIILTILFKQSKIGALRMLEFYVVVLGAIFVGAFFASIETNYIVRMIMDNLHEKLVLYEDGFFW